MRTTLTLDPDVARLLEEEVHRQRKPFKHVVNDAIRKGLASGAKRTGRPYRVRPHKTTLRPGIDAHAFNRLADELEEEASLLRMRLDR
ncbi:MAG: antitoxin [Acidobacteria bacterium SCN 69-37]|nr:MAG: antitoxin [Acidobacteria bacterium SCN 69-37]